MSIDLLKESDALEAAASGYEARHVYLEDFAWPDDVQLAVNFTCDFDAMLLRRLLDEPVGQRAQGEFGGRVGIWRLIALFDHHGVQATIFTPGRICELFPASLKAAAASGHEIADHMWEHRVPREPDVQRAHVVKSAEAIERTVGRRPVGTRSGYRKDFLIDEGFLYDSHGAANHLPYFQSDGARNRMLNLPFHFAIDDAMFFSFAWLGSDNPAQRITDPNRVFDLWWAAFEQQYQAGGYLNICLHPFVSGRALRIAMLDRLICRMKTLPGVWFPTCEAVARYVVDSFAPEVS
jgi:peptidoglycan/xylan/chitin deacetylase (PgdA/CDA1 family)